jgi:hypoxanthine-DNA glycosylase
MTDIRSFPPIADVTANILILGSMPGEESLRAGQYYAHRRNAFWSIMGELVGASPALPYQARALRLKNFGIALWDVLETCKRHGSMDANIEASSIFPNDFKTFLQKHPKITHVFFNGSMAEQYFRKHVLPTLEPLLGLHPLYFQRLPSTSPAHASMTYEQKLKAWKAILRLRPVQHPDGQPEYETSFHAHAGH